jgi:PAS domain S-box-containing protein
LIWLAYVTIPVVLVYFARRPDLPWPWMFWMFGAFIIGCGTTHLMEVVTSYTPLYRLAGVIKVLTAGVSVATAVALVPLVPKALSLQSPAELEREITERKGVEQALRQSEEHFRLLLEGVKDYAICRLLPDGRVASWNAGAQRIYGYPAEEIIGRHFACFFPPDAVERGLPEHELARAAAGRFEDEGWRLRQDGSLFWANAIVTALFDEAGNLTGFAKITRDMTERRRTEEMFRGLLEAAPDAMVIVHGDGTIALVNKQTEQLFGYLREELLGKPVEVLVPTRFHDAHVGHRARYFAQPSVRPMGAGLHLYARRKDGTEFPVEISLSPLTTAEGTLVSAAIRDITPRKLVEDKAAAFAAQLQRSNQELEQFASVASHDLQEPLRKIQTFADRLQAKFALTLGTQGREYLERMHTSAVRMRTLINDLLAFSRVTIQAKPFVAVDLGRVAREVVYDLEDRIQQTHGRVEVGDLPTLEADPVQLRQLLQNLIGNALKFHRPGVPPVVRVEGRVLSGRKRPFTGDGRSDPLVEITVADNGIGFEEKYLNRIFEVFQRLHGRDEYEGTGMGLAICRKIAQRHGGCITGHSTSGQGATFLTLLPQKQAQEETRHDQSSEEAHHDLDG